MKVERDSRTRIVLSWLHEDVHENAERMLLRALDEVDATPQRRSWWPAWRSSRMNTYAKLIAAAAAVLVVAVLGYQLLSRNGGNGGVGGQPASTPSPSPPAALDGIVHFRSDGNPATTEVRATADGASVSGTAVTTFSLLGTHTVRLECAARDGDTWALAGTTEESTVSGERAGDWSAVIVKDGSPQRIGIWLSDPKAEGSDCDGWLASIDLADIGVENFEPVESGALVPPPELAP